jgi:hypothetical protein
MSGQEVTMAKFNAMAWYRENGSDAKTPVKVDGLTVKLTGEPDSYTNAGLAKLARQSIGKISVQTPKAVTETGATTKTTKKFAPEEVAFLFDNHGKEVPDEPKA